MYILLVSLLGITTAYGRGRGNAVMLNSSISDHNNWYTISEPCDPGHTCYTQECSSQDGPDKLLQLVEITQDIERYASMHSVFEADLKKLRCGEGKVVLETFCCRVVETRTAPGSNNIFKLCSIIPWKAMSLDCLMWGIITHIMTLELELRTRPASVWRICEDVSYLWSLCHELVSILSACILRGTPYISKLHIQVV